MTDLPNILQRLEAAIGPSRELDALIACAFDDKVSNPRADGAVDLTMDDGCWNTESLPFTASIDAAIGLVEREYPQGRWVIQDGIPNGPSALIYTDDELEAPHTYKREPVVWAVDMSAPTVPLAILSALLRAKIAEGEKV